MNFLKELEDEYGLAMKEKEELEVNVRICET
jgi:hypothetical protein